MMNRQLNHNNASAPFSTNNSQLGQLPQKNSLLAPDAADAMAASKKRKYNQISSTAQQMESLTLNNARIVMDSNLSKGALEGKMAMDEAISEKNS